MFDATQARKERETARKWSELTKSEQEYIMRVCSVRLWGDATSDTLFTKNRKGEWCRIGG